VPVAAAGDAADVIFILRKEDCIMKKHGSVRAALLMAAVLCILLTLCVSAVRPDESRTIREVYVNDGLDGYRIPYVLYLPADYDENGSYPVLLFLHGADERGDDNERQLFHCVDELYDTRPALMDETIFLLPQCPADEQWVDWPWTDGCYSADEIPESRALSTVMEILDKVLTGYACDTDRVYIMGISMGGYGTWDALVRHESVFAAGVALCGGGDPTKAERLKEIPIWSAHGTADTTVPYTGTREMYDAITAAGGERITFVPIRGGGHLIWDDVIHGGEAADWLFAQNLTLRYPPAPENEPAGEEQPAGEGGSPVGVIAAAAAALVIAAALTVKKRK